MRTTTYAAAGVVVAAGSVAALVALYSHFARSDSERSDGGLAVQPAEQARAEERSEVVPAAPSEDQDEALFERGPAASAASAPPASEPPPDPEAHYQLKYDGLSPEVLTSVCENLFLEYKAATKPIYEERWESGQYELAANFIPGEEIQDDLFHLEDDPYSVRFTQDGEIRRVVLTREEFPDIWDAWQEIRWLKGHARKLNAQRARQLHGYQLGRER